MYVEVQQHQVHPVDLYKPAIGGQDNYEKSLFKQRLIEILNIHDPFTPLFLYYALHTMHSPLQVLAYDRQYYHAMVDIGD